MKILIVCQFYYPENFTISSLAEKLVSYGHEVDVLTGKPNYGFGKILDGYENVNFEVINGVNVHRVNVLPRGKKKRTIIYNYLSYWWRAKRWVGKCKKKYDVVYSMSLSPVTILSPANKYKRKFKVKHLCHCVDLWPESVLVTNAVKEKSLTYKILFKWSKRLYKQTDKILIGSPSFESYFKDVLHLSNKREFVPQSALHTLKEGDKPFIFNDDKFHILYCGNIGTVQMVEDIPLALKDINNDKVHFDIIGYGTNEDILLNRIKQYKLEDKITYHGPIKSIDTVKYFLSADALYVSLKGEGYVGKTIPNKLVMAMAFKKPILATLTGDGKDILEQSKGGFIALENTSSLIQKINELINCSKQTLETMANNNYEYYLKHFDLDTVSKKIEKELIELVD